MIDFEWHNGIAKVRKDIIQQEEIKINDKHNNIQILHKQPIHKAERILGAYQAPLNDRKAQTKALRSKIDKFTNRLKLQRLPTHLAWAAIQSRAYVAVEWPLRACTLSEQQCSHILAPLLIWGLRALGVQSNINRSLVFGAPSLMGLGFKSIYTPMGIERCLHMLNHGHENTMPGKLF